MSGVGLLTLDLPEPAVVPVIVNTGAALLPALAGAMAGVVAVLLNPRHLFATVRRYPLRICLGLGAVIGCGWGVSWLVFSEDTVAAKAPAEGRWHDHNVHDGRYWAAFAQSLLDAEVKGQPWFGQEPELTEILIRLKRLEDKMDSILARGNGPGWENPKKAVMVEKTKQTTPSAIPGPTKEALIFRIGMGRTGSLNGRMLRKLRVAWKYYDDGLMFWGSPVGDGKRVYGTWCYLDPPQTYGGVFCLDAATGHKYWEVDTKPDGKEIRGLFSSPALSSDGRYLVVGEGLHPDYDSELMCLDTRTGKFVWRCPTPLHIESSPAIDGNLVVVGVGAVEGRDHKPRAHADPAKNGNPGFVMAVDLRTGKMLWKQVVKDPESSPLIVNDRVIIGSGFNGHAVVALDRHTGRILWETTVPYPVTGAISASGTMVLAGCGNSDYVQTAPEPKGLVVCLDLTTGRKLWSLAMADSVLAPIALHRKKAFVPVRNGELVCLDLDTGKKPEERWRIRLRQRSLLLSGVAVCGHLVYALTSDGYLFVLDATSGETLEHHYINGRPGELGMCIGGPVMIKDRLFVGTETGGFICMRGTVVQGGENHE